jgi:hypothetical protein
MSLNQPANRGAFVKNFETYIEYAKKSCTVCKDLRMLRYQILEEIRLTILQTQCIFFPKLKNANVDSLETLIHEGISELKIKTNNPELNALQKKFTIT